VKDSFVPLFAALNIVGNNLAGGEATASEN
jgi:hypothetical protein